MVFTEKMLAIKQVLEGQGHTVFVSCFSQEYVGKTEHEKEELTLFHKNEKDAIREFYEKIKECDAILVLNYDRRGIQHYIGGNTLMEIGFAHVLHKKIFFMNPVPIIPYYQSELEAVKPTIIHGDLSKLN